MTKPPIKHKFRLMANSENAGLEEAVLISYFFIWMVELEIFVVLLSFILYI